MHGAAPRAQRFAWLLTIAVVLVPALTPIMVAAQTVTGTIQGTVSDSSGAVLPGATVTVRNVETGAQRTVVTNETGFYTTPFIQIGRYTLTATLSGFGTATVRLERSFDGGSSWKTVSKPDLTAASFTADVDGVGEEPEIGLLYRFNCTAFTAGPIAYRISQ